MTLGTKFPLTLNFPYDSAETDVRELDFNFC
jgi:hypothetical protein